MRHAMKRQLTFLMTIWTTTVCGQVEQKQNPADFLPGGYVVFEKINGDLNKDGREDCVLIIKGTDTSRIITDKYRGRLDRNRRGMIVLFQKDGLYEQAVKNIDCFSSENEDGGVYFAPELSVEIKDGKLYVHYAHGRYGYWRYTFRYQNTDFELIGYDAGYRSDFISDYVTFDEESINFLSKRKLEKKVIKVSAEGKESFRETWEDINVSKLIRLSEIKDFDELDITKN